MLPDEVFSYYASRGPSSSGRVNVARALRKVPQTTHAWAKAGYVPWSAQLELQHVTGGGLVAKREDLPVELGGSLRTNGAPGVSGDAAA